VRISGTTALILLVSSLSLSAIEADLAYMDDITALTEKCFIRAITLDGVLRTDDTGETYEALVGSIGLVDCEYTVQESGGPISTLYRIGGIPMAYLIGTDGAIIARGLRGQRLLDAVADALREGDEEVSGK